MKSNFLIKIFLFLIATTSVQAQLQTAHWYFGKNAGLDFSSGSPVVVTDGQINTEEGCSSISDEYGDLLFYTDGRKIYDASHNIMENGTGLRGDTSSTTSAIILPLPDNCNLYYVFTIEVQDGRVPSYRPKRGIEYNIVDMSLNGGLGAVIEKNIEVPINGVQQGSERLAAISNADKTGYWIVTFFEGDFYAFSVTDSGIDLNPVVSPSPGIQPIGPDRGWPRWENDIGYLKGSPDGSKLAMGKTIVDCWDGYLTVYDFDNATGVVSNEIILFEPNPDPDPDVYRGFYGIEFSANSKVLYAGSENYICNDGESPSVFYNIWQYNLEASSVPDSKYVIENGKWGALQRGLDGKIYHVGLYSLTLYMGIIEDPNTVYNPVTGEAPVYDPEGIYMGETTYWGLPTFLNHYFRIAITVNGLSIKEDQLYCTGELLDFSFCSQGGEIQSVHWDFGDGQTSNEFYPQHQYNSPGVYTITLTLMVDGEEHIRTFDITISGPDAENAILETCNTGDSQTFNLLDALPQINPTNTELSITFYQTEPDAHNNENPLPNTFTTSTTTIVYVRAEDSNGCYVVRELELVIYPLPDFETETTLDACSGDFIVLSVITNPTNTVNWYGSVLGTVPLFTGSTFETPILTTTTHYWVEVVSENGCISERIEITIIIPTQELPNFNLEQLYCLNDYTDPLPTVSDNGISGTWEPSIIDTSILGTQSYVFTSIPGNCSEVFQITLSIEVIDIITPQFNLLTNCIFWGETLNPLPNLSDNGISGAWYPAEIDVNANTSIIYTFTPDPNQCAEVFQTEIKTINYPKFFTPNNDGFNDFWNIPDMKDQIGAEIIIYDRFGKILSVISPQGLGWDGTYNGQPLPSTDYWFVVTCQIDEGQQRKFKAHFTLKR